MKIKTVSDNKKLLAYIIGIALGDGNLSNPNGRAVRLRISCDTKYPKLIIRIQECLKILLPDNKVQLVKRKANCVDISCYSNKWPILLGWNVGNKIQQKVKIPEWVLDDLEYAKYCLQGMLETDGAVYLDRTYKSVIFVNAVENLAQGAYKIICNLGFDPKIYKKRNRDKIIYHVRLTRNVDSFLNLVKVAKE